VPEIPHFRHPFGRDPRTGKVAVVEQDTPEHVISCENVIVACPIGARDARPEFGWAWPEFRTAPLDVAGLEKALREFEPRSRATASEKADSIDAALRRIAVKSEVEISG
jgi:phage baseplate assembly protein W